MPKHAFVVTGPVSSGNRLITSYLVRAGCEGSGSTNQHSNEELAKGEMDNLVVIAHDGGLVAVLEILKLQSYDIKVVVVLREESALIKSQVKQGHYKTVKKARYGLTICYPRIFTTLLMEHVTNFTVVSLESVILHPFATIKAMLERLSLPTHNLTESIEVNLREVSPIPHDPNVKHYGEMPEPPNRIEYGSQLIWWPERGFGYYPVKDFQAYDAAYWQKYEGYAATEQGKLLTQARCEMVGNYAGVGNLIDVGIGCGQFVETRGHGTRGYDVNPIAVHWLKERRLWTDVYQESLTSISCWDSLEHIPDPARLLSRVRSHVFISIPIFRNAEHVLESRHFRKDEHYWYFTEEGLVRWMASRKFEVQEINEMEMTLGREDIKSYAFKRVM